MAKYVLEFEKPILDLEDKIAEMKGMSEELDIGPAIKVLENKVEELKVSIYSQLTRWQRVQLARHPDRPYTLDYIKLICSDFIELHGDKSHGDDMAIVGGIAQIEDLKLVIIGHQKGHDTKENLKRNFGMPNPEGYRKALKLMRFAEKFKMPVVTFIDTPGAYPGIEAEERGQAEAIARNLFEMAKLRTPILNIVIGEGASGGALGIGMGDCLMVMENTWFSVISPESCSSILWKSWDYKEQAAEALKLTAFDLIKQGIADDIIKEPLGGAHVNYEETSIELKNKILSKVKELISLDIKELLNKRHLRYDKIGIWNN